VIEVACSCAGDGAYAPHSAAMLHSLLTSARREPVRIHYLHGAGFPHDDPIRAMVEGMHGTIAFHEIEDERLAQLPVLEHAPASLWYRLLLPELCDADRVLYLDLDVIVVEEIHDLWATPLQGHALGAVNNVFMPQHVARVEALGLDPSHYLNTGVLLLDLATWRREGIGRMLLEFAREHARELEWADQDAMNLLLGTRWLELHPRWNAMNSLWTIPAADAAYAPGEAQAARLHPAIRHYEGAGANKPWHERPTVPGVHLYGEHRAATPWPRWRPGRATRALRRLRRRD
jgi:lipopolysaccharide biosynthesis glycosyltransferase